jgi:DNA-binding winged helix-turn-helix (wHTH) protein/Tfp pilus assembly protein PilF
MGGREVYEFGDFILDAPKRMLSRDGHAIALAPKSYDLLVALVRSGGRLTTKRELLDLVWRGAFVEEGILAVHISNLRKALGDDRRERHYIETVSRTGYRFVAAVRRVAEDEMLPAQPSVAVLPARPFTSEMFSERDRHSGLALADALIDRLGRSGQIVVRPTRAVRAYVNEPGDPGAIGRWLRVDAVIETRFVATAERVTISVHLTRSLDGSNLWTGNFDEPAAGLIGVADWIAEQVAAKLGAGFREGPTPRRTIRPAAHAEVYELFGRGRFHLLSYSMFEVAKAEEAFRAAIELDSTYAPAHAGLALSCCAQAAMRVAPPAEAYNEARAAALRALAMDDSCADAQVALGAVLFFAEWDWGAAERSLKRALQLNPNHSEGFLLYGQLLETLGRLAEGLQMKLRALERDPFSPLVNLQISVSYWNQNAFESLEQAILERRYDEAIEWANKTLAIDPRHPHAREHLAGAYWKRGDSDRYLSENLKHAELHGAPAEALERLKQAYAAGGVAGVLKLGLEFAANHPHALPAMQLALFHGELGAMDQGFKYLEQAIESHDPGLVHLAVGPQWDCLRSDPRFKDALSRMGLPAVPQANVGCAANVDEKVFRVRIHNI